jgi:hypothetical protein
MALVTETTTDLRCFTFLNEKKQRQVLTGHEQRRNVVPIQRLFHGQHLLQNFLSLLLLQRKTKRSRSTNNIHVDQSQCQQRATVLQIITAFAATRNKATSINFHYNFPKQGSQHADQMQMVEDIRIIFVCGRYRAQKRKIVRDQ